MKQLIKNLKGNGVKEKFLKEDEVVVIDQLLKCGIVYKTYKNGFAAYKLANTARIYRGQNGFNFELVPNRHMGVIFEKEDIFECVSSDKNAPELYCLTYKLNPSEDEVKNFRLGETVRVKVIARGYDIGNEGLAVKLPRSEEDMFAMERRPCITIGLANGAKGKNTSSLNFDEPISGTFIEGRKALIVKGNAYYNVKDIDVVADVYFLEDNTCELKKQITKKLVR